MITIQNMTILSNSLPFTTCAMPAPSLRSICTSPLLSIRIKRAEFDNISLTCPLTLTKCTHYDSTKSMPLKKFTPTITVMKHGHEKKKVKNVQGNASGCVARAGGIKHEKEIMPGEAVEHRNEP